MQEPVPDRTPTGDIVVPSRASSAVRGLCQDQSLQVGTELSELRGDGRHEPVGERRGRDDC